MHEHRPFRRRITLRRPTPGSVQAELEDHIHHVAVTIEHEDGRVRSITGRGIRLPWSSCPGAAAALHELVGSEIGSSPQVADMSAHCTHLLDCASSGIRFAGSAARARRYEIEIADWDSDVTTAVVRRDDGPELVVRTDGTTILEPAHMEGRSLGAGFTRWATQELDPEVAEMAILLRRAIWMRRSRGIDLDQVDTLDRSGVAPASCYASQPQRIHVATRVRGSSVPALDDS